MVSTCLSPPLWGGSGWGMAYPYSALAWCMMWSSMKVEMK